MSRSLDFAKLEEWIRLGKFLEVAQVLQSLNLKTIPREQYASIANLANRVDRSHLAFRLLNPIVYSEQEFALPPSEMERIEYAEAIRRMGLVDEAIEIFNSVDAAKFPVVQLRLAFCFFKQWKYAAAISPLKTLIQTVSENEYISTIAKVNLAAALVHEREFEEAKLLLHELTRKTQQAGQSLLYGNSLELTAQIHISLQDWAAARQTLDQAETTFSGNSSKYALFVHKWRAIAKSLETGIVQSELKSCRETAKSNSDWETLRDCDLYIGHIEKNESLLHKVYFGSPQSSFRKRVRHLVGENYKFPQSLLWDFSGCIRPEHIFDLTSAAFDKMDSGASLQIGGRLHQLLILLCSDFYQPLSVPTAFSKLFVGEHYTQTGSANRVRQLLSRLRAWMEETSTGLRLEEKNGKYRIQCDHADFAIRVYQEIPDLESNSLKWQSFDPLLPKRNFSRNDLEQASLMSAANAKRLLRWACDSGHIEVIGGGAKTKYQRINSLEIKKIAA